VLLHFGQAAWAGQFYFLVLVQVYLLTGVLLPARVWQAPAVLALSGAALLAGVALFASPDALARVADHSLGRLLLQASSGGWFWFWYFALGAWLGRRERVRAAAEPERGGAPDGGAAARQLALALAGVAIAGGLPLLFAGGDPRLHAYARLHIALGATLLGLALPSLARLRFGSALEALGRESFALYVFNPAFLIGLGRIFGEPDSVWTSWLAIAATALLAWAAAPVVRRRLPWALA
jgi:hypothetical protein